MSDNETPESILLANEIRLLKLERENLRKANDALKHKLEHPFSVQKIRVLGERYQQYKSMYIINKKGIKMVLDEDEAQELLKALLFKSKKNKEVV